MKASGGVRESPRAPHFVPLGIRPASRKESLMPMKTSTRFVKAAILEYLHSARTVHTVRVACALRLPHGDAGAGRGLDLAYVLDQLRVCVVHRHHHRNDPWGCRHGFRWAMKRSNPSEGAKFGALVNVPINTVYSVILCYLVGTLDACVLGGAPFIASIFGFLQNIIPVWGCLLRGDLPPAGSHRELCAQGVQRPCSGDAADALGFDCPLWACA